MHSNFNTKENSSDRRKHIFRITKFLKFSWYEHSEKSSEPKRSKYHGGQIWHGDNSSATHMMKVGIIITMHIDSVESQ